MVQSNAGSVDEYLKDLSPDRRDSITTVRNLILENLPQGYVGNTRGNPELSGMSVPG